MGRSRPLGKNGSELIRWKRDGQRGRHAVDQGRPDEVSSHRVDTVNDPTTPWQILGDIRESLGRLEGKFDAQSERNKTNEPTMEHHDVRLPSLETTHDRSDERREGKECANTCRNRR